MRNTYRITLLMIFSLFSINLIIGNNPIPSTLLSNETALDNGITLEISSGITCNGDEDATLTTTINAPSCPMESIVYTWMKGGNVLSNETSASLENIGAGNYQVSVSFYDVEEENPACTCTETITVEEPEEITVSFQQVMQVDCNGGSNGRARAVGNGGTGNYSYSWDNGVTVANSPNMIAGTYAVTVTDNNGCTGSNTITIQEPEAITISFQQIMQVSCNGGNDGRARAVGAGGVVEGNYSYSWDNGTTTANATNLTAGTYSVIVTDDNGCTESNTITIEEPEPIIPNIAMTNHIPCSGGFGGLEVNPVGGTLDYSYNWSNGSDTNTAESETPGFYSVTITDNNNCSAIATEELILGTPPQINSFADFLTFEDGRATEVEYTLDMPEATLDWEILDPVNIKTNISSYISEGQSPNPISLTLSLKEDRIPGSVILRVYPRINQCIGDPVETAIHIYPEGNPIHIPELFSPNEDGTNDTWEITVPSNDSPDNYCINIYSKNGQKVYEAKSLETPWTGEECPEGTYYYIIEDKMDKSTFRGVVSILR